MPTSAVHETGSIYILVTDTGARSQRLEELWESLLVSFSFKTKWMFILFRLEKTHNYVECMFADLKMFYVLLFSSYSVEGKVGKLG